PSATAMRLRTRCPRTPPPLRCPDARAAPQGTDPIFDFFSRRDLSPAFMTFHLRVSGQFAARQPSCTVPALKLFHAGCKVYPGDRHGAAPPFKHHSLFANRP